MNPELLSWLAEPLSIEPRWLETFLAETKAGSPQARASGSAASSGATIAVMSIRGPLVARESWLTREYGFVSYEWINATVDRLVADPSVRGLILDFESPGGTTMGALESADKIRAAAKVKDVRAISNGHMASAAYMLGSQAREVVVSPSGMIGNIGTIFIHVDASKAEERWGIKSTPIYAGKYKAEGRGPLDDETRARLQVVVDHYYDQLVGAVARGRGARPETVKAGFGEGRYLTAREGVEQRLADREGTLEDLIRRMAGRSAAAAARARAIDLDALEN